MYKVAKENCSETFEIMCETFLLIGNKKIVAIKGFFLNKYLDKMSLKYAILQWSLQMYLNIKHII